MIISCKNISRKRFEQINFYETSEKVSRSTHCYISIHSPEDYEKTLPSINHQKWADGIQLAFYDIDEDVKGMKAISSEQAKEIVEFIQRIHSFPFPVHLIVHCFAGVSRSAAVGKFVSDALKLNFPQYEHLQIYNKKVYSSLSNVFFGGKIYHDQ
jgi:predicted protein tyrosine phosphatase